MCLFPFSFSFLQIRHMFLFLYISVSCIFRQEPKAIFCSDHILSIRVRRQKQFLKQQNSKLLFNIASLPYVTPWITHFLENQKKRKPQRVPTFHVGLADHAGHGEGPLVPQRRCVVGIHLVEYAVQNVRHKLVQM